MNIEPICNCLCVDTDFNSVEACDFKDKNILILDNTPETINKGSEKEKQKKMPKRHTCDHCKSTFCTNRGKYFYRKSKLFPLISNSLIQLK